MRMFWPTNASIESALLAEAVRWARDNDISPVAACSRSVARTTRGLDIVYMET